MTEKERRVKAIPAGALKLLSDDAPEGSFEARFAKLDTLDLDGEVIPSGAVGVQDIAISAWQHDHRSLPVGVGRTAEEDGFAVVRGQFLMDTQGGADTYRVVKAMGDRQEWSFGFFVDAVEWREFGGHPSVPHLTGLDIFEASPVYRGAGIETATTDIKCAGCRERAGHAPEPVKQSEETASPDALYWHERRQRMAAALHTRR